MFHMFFDDQPQFSSLNDVGFNLFPNVSDVVTKVT